MVETRVRNELEDNFDIGFRLLRFVIIGLVILGLVFGLIFSGIYKIDAGYRGVVLTFGKPSETIAQEGINFKIPLVQTVKKYEVRTQKIESIADSASLDLQDVQTTVALNFHVDPGKINKLHQEIGMDYKVRVIDPAVEEAVKAATAQFKAEDLIQKRPEARQRMKEILEEKLGKYYIIIRDFNIINFQFSEEFDKAIEQKVTAEQLKLKADRDLERIEVEAKQVMTRADAEAYALTRKADAISKSQDIVALKQIEIQMEAINKWDGVLPKVTGGATPFVNLENLEEVNAPQPTP